MLGWSDSRSGWGACDGSSSWHGRARGGAFDAGMRGRGPRRCLHPGRQIEPADVGDGERPAPHNARQYPTQPDTFAAEVAEKCLITAFLTAILATHHDSRRHAVWLPSRYPSDDDMAKALTDLTIAKLKPGSARREIPDRTPLLYLIVQPTGRRRFALRYRFDGK